MKPKAQDCFTLSDLKLWINFWSMNTNMSPWPYEHMLDTNFAKRVDAAGIPFPELFVEWFWRVMITMSHLNVHQTIIPQSAFHVKGVRENYLDFLERFKDDLTKSSIDDILFSELEYQNDIQRITTKPSGATGGDGPT